VVEMTTTIHRLRTIRIPIRITSAATAALRMKAGDLGSGPELSAELQLATLLGIGATIGTRAARLALGGEIAVVGGVMAARVARGLRRDLLGRRAIRRRGMRALGSGRAHVDRDDVFCRLEIDTPHMNRSLGKAYRNVSYHVYSWLCPAFAMRLVPLA
jgi:hypothetical protein